MRAPGESSAHFIALVFKLQDKNNHIDQGLICNPIPTGGLNIVLNISCLISDFPKH